MIVPAPPEAASRPAGYRALKRGADALVAAAGFVLVGPVCGVASLFTAPHTWTWTWTGAGSRAARAVHASRRVLVVGVHVVLIVVANYAAFWLRFDGSIPEREMALFVRMLPVLVTIFGLMFIPFRLYGGLWRYTGIWDLQSIIAGVTAGSVWFFIVVHWIVGIAEYPRSVYLIEPVLLIFFMGGLRLVWRLYPELRRARREKRVLIIGAGNAGEMIVREMKKDPSYDYEPIGFVDDDPAKVGHRIHGVPVLGGRQDLSRIMIDEAPHEVLVAIPRADPPSVRGIVKILEPFKVPLTTLPNFRDIVNGKVAVSQIRSLSIEDLLARAPVGLDVERVRHLITGKRIIVTGAGGSIGSELCRQIAALRPSALVLYERYENGLYAVANDLADSGLAGFVHSVIGDVTDQHRLNAVLAQQRPHIIFHAAAHKHVPLMELNPCEAVKNNVVGTRMVAEAAARYGVERFILISTDKAVNPSSVMGATKRVAELIQQTMARRGRTRFVTVRFGNVLGSNGSVVLRFLDQIKAGGPVTVTHPDMRRYFMLIPEAVQLVLYAAALGEGGAVYVLEMGEQINLVDMARNLIRLSGFVPEEEIPICFIGMRPGEKLSESLIGADETVEPAASDSILRVTARSLPDEAFLKREIAELERLAARGESAAVVQQLAKIAPTFSSEWSIARRDALVGFPPTEGRRAQARDGTRRPGEKSVRGVADPVVPRKPTEPDPARVRSIGK
jgi:FlaA1/EpsC-like NDP-sugar epimerase